MIGIKVEITRFISNDQPGWIECKFKDVWDEEHVVIEKIPVITTLDINEQSTYPLEAYIACEILKEQTDSTGRKIITVSSGKPWGISNINGLIEFDLLEDMLGEFS